MRSTTAILVGSFLICRSILAQEPEPLGDEFRVNSYAGIWQFGASVAADPQGNFVVTWTSIGSPGNDDSDDSVQAQRFDASGSTVGSQFQVNTYTTEFQRGSEVAIDPQGNFVAVWDSDGSYGTDTGSKSIQAQRYDASGALVGGEVQVNSDTTNTQLRPDVAADAQGNLVVVWESIGSSGTDTSYGSIQGQRYDASGSPVGGQFQVNTYTTGAQTQPNVAADSRGSFVVAWSDTDLPGIPTREYNIRARRFDESGVPLGGDFQINSYSTSYQWRPAVAADTEGNFVVVWTSSGSYGTDTDYSVEAQRFDASGTPVGQQFQVNSYTTSGQSADDVATDPQGNFVVVWTSDGSYTETVYPSVQAQLFDSSGSPVGGQFQVNTPASYYETGGRIAIDGQGNFVVVWGEGNIWGQRFTVSLVFADDFESGDTSGWSSTQ